MSSWLDPLLDPHELEIAAQRGSQHPRGGLALLLDAQLFLYERLASSYAWPRLGSRPRKTAPREHQLLAAVGLHLTGGRGASQTYDTLLKSARTDEPFFVTVASILYSMHLAAQDDAETAIGVLHNALSAGADDSVERTLLLVHLGVREAERDNLQEAIALTEMARAALRGRRSSQMLVVQTVAQHNLFAYKSLVGEHVDVFGLPRRGAELALLRGAVDVSVGLSKYLQDQFDQATRDPYSRSMSWRPEDPVEMPLRGAVIRAECLGDWVDQRQAWALLGRYHVASKLGTSDGVPPQAFELLRRANDDAAVTGAARSVAAIGPVGALRSQLLQVLKRPWPRTQVAATLALISSGADFLQPKEARQFLGRLEASEEVLLQKPRLGFRALAQVIAVSPDSAHTSASRFARKLALYGKNPLVAQGLEAVLETLHWQAISQAERNHWLVFLRDPNLSRDDSLFERVAIGLGRVEPQTVGEILRTADDAALGIDQIAVFLDAGLTLSRRLRESSLETASDALARIRHQAHEGAYSYGGVDVGFLMLSLLGKSSRDSRWDELADFLLDPRVGVGEKVRTIDTLAEPECSIPARIQDRLRQNVATVTGFIDHLGASEASLRGATLRLWLKLGGVKRDELLGQLLELAGDLDREARRQAARTLPAAQRRLGDDATFTLGLTLTRDHDVSVRARAGRSLALLQRDGAGELGAVAVSRVEALLEEPGTLVPYEAIAGLIEAGRAGQMPPRALISVVERIRLTHPSRRLQIAAKTLTNESRQIA